MMPRILSIASLALICTACADTDDRPVPAKPEFLNSPAALERGLPFSEAVRAGDLLFLAGQIGTDPATGQLVPGGWSPKRGRRSKTSSRCWNATAARSPTS